MNGGAYGRETCDILVECDVVLRSGERRTLTADELGYSYRHSELPEQAVVISATFRGEPKRARRRSRRRWTASPQAREESQPLRSRTGGSTFKNPLPHKAWAVIDAAGCRGLTVGGAQVSEKHCNFLLNLGSATSADIEALGEEVRRRVKADSGHQPRMGNPADRQCNEQGNARRRADGRLVGRARGVADQRARDRRGAARARLEPGHRARHGPRRRRAAGRAEARRRRSTRCTARRARTARSRACST